MLCRLSICGLLPTTSAVLAAAADGKPNVILFLCDDVGYGKRQASSALRWAGKVREECRRILGLRKR